VTVWVDARAAARPELGGVERWARELAVRLPALRPGAYAVARPPAGFAHRAGHAWEQGWLPLRARRADWLLCPANLAPLAHPRVAVVIHDAAALREPAWYSPGYARAQAVLLPRIARRARLVMTVSEFSRAELRELLGVDAVVVPGGVDHARFHPRAGAGGDGGDGGQGYVLTVGAGARKNLGALAETARRLRLRGLELWAAGGSRPQVAGEEVPGIRRLGHVPDAGLPALYARARAFVLPSLHEGFGLPLLEAMACGVPVVAARAGALPETSAGAARLADPRDPEALAAAVEEVLDDPAPWRAAGLARAGAFSWARTAAAVDALVQR